MKRIFSIAIVFFLLSETSKAQRSVYDESNDMQRQRMVFVRWNKFKPDGLFDVYWSLFHSEYRKKDKRVLGPVGPYLIHESLLQAQNNQDEQYRLSTDTIANKHLIEDLNSSGGALRYSDEKTPVFREKVPHLFRSKVHQPSRPLSPLRQSDIFQT